VAEEQGCGYTGGTVARPEVSFWVCHMLECDLGQKPSVSASVTGGNIRTSFMEL
jgi:hypothetical protein